MSRPVRVRRSSSAEVLAAIEAFLAASREPVLQEPGEHPYPLTEGRYAFDAAHHALLLTVWDNERQLHRRVTAVTEQRPGRLTLAVERFGGRTGTIVLLDADRPQNQSARRQGERHLFREQLRTMVQRAFPEWKIAELSADLDLEHSLSANYPRGLLRQGRRAWAIIGAAAGQSDPQDALTYGLIWLAYLRRREPELVLSGLALFLPTDGIRTTALRLRLLDPSKASYKLFTYSEYGQIEECDPADWGNLETQLWSASPEGEVPPELAGVATHPSVDVIAANGGLRLSLRGLPIAHWREGKWKCGVAGARASLLELPGIVRELDRMRSHDAADRSNPIYTRHPEAWLESQVRRNIHAIDASLQTAPIYGQVMALAGLDRGIADLLAADSSNRLAVIEMKASEDIHLPLQALDYWMRIAWHAERGDFKRQGYFSGIELRPDPPRLLLVAPALCFHPTTETILEFVSSNVSIERIGVGVDWRERLRAVFRFRGAERPS